MSRSGYTDDMDDQWAHIRWRGVVASAMRGKRGQAFLKEMLAALDAMPVKRLIAHELAVPLKCRCSWCQEQVASVCAIGAVGRARGMDMSKLDPDDYDTVAWQFGIASPLAQEIVFMNDECGYFPTPEARFDSVRAWVVSCITPVKSPETPL